ncbi:biotin carboxylase N-terminal domain-containing protein [Sphingobacterium populi]|uniref:Biotin carboxylase N-terminal domain-containing protein n=2 Tax=Sphingobacterium TaxID=28453 RepID=A0ABW5UEU5_9SPHI
MFKKLLIANRGENAIQVIRAAARMNIKTVAVYTYEDRFSLHGYKADESYQIGTVNQVSRPYDDVEEIMRIAIEHDVDAIHTGNGLLENDLQFTKRCQDVGITIVNSEYEGVLKMNKC